MNQSKMLEYKDLGEGKLEFRLDLAMLYGESEERREFERNLVKFLNLEDNAGIVKVRSDDHVIYYSKEIIPQKQDGVNP